MSYGMQIAASGALTSLYRMDVLANNLANLSTVGFKADSPVLMQRDPVRIEDGVMLPSDTMLERLGAGVMPARNRISFEQGSMISTGNPLDVAIEGNGFFVLLDERAEEADRLRLTRDGRFTRNGDGTLVSSASGRPVLDTSNRQIVLPDASPILIGPDGSIRQNGAEVAKLQVCSVPDQSRLAKVGNGMFRAPAEAMSGLVPATGVVKQGVVESSSVDPVRVLMRVTDAGRDVEANLGMIASHDRLTERAINGLGRIA
ncbi:MAG: flagellar hook basal-body protein [Phycisphaeraceae bacterium]|nr:flagellar hook basal-body protein [Phycisphaeraceae bacterium]